MKILSFCVLILTILCLTSASDLDLDLLVLEGSNNFSKDNFYNIIKSFDGAVKEEYILTKGNSINSFFNNNSYCAKAKYNSMMQTIKKLVNNTKHAYTMNRSSFMRNYRDLRSKFIDYKKSMKKFRTVEVYFFDC